MTLNFLPTSQALGLQTCASSFGLEVLILLTSPPTPFFQFWKTYFSFFHHGCLRLPRIVSKGMSVKSGISVLVNVDGASPFLKSLCPLLVLEMIRDYWEVWDHRKHKAAGEIESAISDYGSLTVVSGRGTAECLTRFSLQSCQWPWWS